MIYSFNAATVEKVEPKSREPVPEGTYLAMITRDERLETKTPGNYRLSLTWEIVDGEHKGRLVFDSLNLWRNMQADSDAYTIARAESTLADICTAVGVTGFNDTAELHDKIIKIHVIVRPPQKNYGASNAIVAYKSINGGSTLPLDDIAPATKPATAKPSSGSSGLPWE